MILFGFMLNRADAWVKLIVEYLEILKGDDGNERLKKPCVESV